MPSESRHDKTCGFCGVAFHAKHVLTKYCSPSCKRRAKAKRVRERKSGQAQPCHLRHGCETCDTLADCRRYIAAGLPGNCEQVWPVDVRYAAERGVLGALLELRPEARGVVG